MTRRVLKLALISMGWTWALLAQSGAVIIRIPDGTTSSCINASTDQVYLTIRRVITTKRNQWFTSDKSVGVLVNAAVSPAQGPTVNFPLMSDVNISDYHSGQIDVPVEYGILRGFPLKQGSTMYTSFQVDITLLNRRGKNAWGKALDALVEVSKKLPIPNTPTASAATYLLDFANNAVNKEMAAQDQNDKLKSATLALNFDPTGRCAGRTSDGGDWERTGTLAIVQGGTANQAGVVDISKPNDYCWKAELRPAFVLYASPKSSRLACTDAAYKPNFQSVTNNYTGFYMNAITASGKMSGNDPKRLESLKRCDANGVPSADCLSSGGR